MRIVLTTDKLNKGGKEKQLLLLAKGLHSRGYETFILSKKPIDRTDYYKDVDYPEHLIQVFGQNTKAQTRKYFQRIITQKQPSVVMSFDIQTSIWSQMISKRLVNSQLINCTIRRGIPYESIKSRILSRICLKRSKFIVANSKAGLDLFKVQASKNHKVIYNGIDLTYFREATPFPLNDIFGTTIPEDALIIANIGNLHPHKGQLTLIEALSILDNKKVFAMIIGEGPERRLLQSKINEFGLSNSVRLLGRRSNVASLLKSADLYINPSWGEGCSNAILEAMACNLFIVTTPDGGTPEIVNTQTTSFFPKNDAKELAIKISEHLDKSVYNTNVLNDWMKKYNHEHMVDQYETYIHNIVLGDQ